MIAQNLIEPVKFFRQEPEAYLSYKQAWAPPGSHYISRLGSGVFVPAAE
jgi:hypothetical protein